MLASQSHCVSVKSFRYGTPDQKNAALSGETQQKLVLQHTFNNSWLNKKRPEKRQKKSPSSTCKSLQNFITPNPPRANWKLHRGTSQPRGRWLDVFWGSMEQQGTKMACTCDVNVIHNQDGYIYIYTCISYSLFI